MPSDLLTFLAGFVAGMGLVVSMVLLIVFDMFGAPHSRKKYWFEFWRSK